MAYRSITDILGETSLERLHHLDENAMQLLGQLDLVALIGADKQVARDQDAAVLLLVCGQEIVDGGEL
jgi:hypothetical protein